MQQSVNFDRAAGYYDKTRGFPEDHMPRIGAFIARCAGLDAGDHLLEIGVGTGRIALPVAPFVGRITGIDISSGMMAVLKHKQTTEPVYLALADALHLPFSDHSFEHATFTHVLHLVADPQRVLDELLRVTKPDGMVISMRNKYGSQEAIQPLVNAWNAHIDRTESAKGASRWDKIDGYMTGSGWTLRETHSYHFSGTMTPADFIERIEKRQWSSTWALDDAVIEAGLRDVYAALEAHFDGNRHAEIHTDRMFQVDVYKRD